MEHLPNELKYKINDYINGEPKTNDEQCLLQLTKDRYVSDFHNVAIFNYWNDNETLGECFLRYLLDNHYNYYQHLIKSKTFSNEEVLCDYLCERC